MKLKKIMASMLAICMVLSPMGTVAFAEDAPAPICVATVDGVEYTDIQEAIKAAAPNKTVEIQSDITVDKWIMFSQRLSIGSGQIITLDMNGLTIKGNGKTLTVNSVESATNGDRLFHEADNLNIENLTINYADGVVGGISLKSGELKDVTINGGVGVLPGTGDITITGCKFYTNGSAIYNEENRDNLVVTGNHFETAEGQYAIYLRGNTTFTDNTVVTGKVNVVNGSPVVTGNDFGDERFKVYNGAMATISNNTINNLVFNDNSEVKSAFSSNTLSAEAQTALEAVAPAAKAVATINGVEYETLAKALEATSTMSGDVVIELLADAELSYGAREAYGSTNITSITINGNGKTLTLDQTDSDWSSIGMANAGGVFKMNNVTVDKTGYGATSGAWNTHAINFTVNTEFKDVTFNNSIKVSGTSVLTNVDVVEAGGYYGIWIPADATSVTINGGSITATNGGRGIKIADQYVANPVQVKLTVDGMKFETAKKAAVLVTSKAGADITATNCDITKVAADSVNFAWVDEDPAYADSVDKITVNGEAAFVEGTVATINGVGYTDITTAFDKAVAGDEVMICAAGTYKVPTGKNITITGAVDGVVFDNIGACGMNSSVTFNNVTFDYYPNVNYTGLQHAGNMVYNDCTINGQVFLYGTSETFNNCIFNQTSSDAYNVWTYGAKKVAFNECTFNSAGKSVLIYSEDANLFNDVTVTKTTFNASTPVDGKAAIEMDSSLTSGINLTIDGATTATGFGSGNVSGNSLWNNKKGNTGVNNDITVMVNNETVLKPKFAAKIGEIKYETIKDAINAAKVGDTVTILAGTYAVPSMKAGITIEGEGDVLLEGTIGGTLENLTLKNLHIKGGNTQRWAYAKGNLTFENVTFEATSVYALHFDGITAGANLLYKDCTIIGWAAMSGSPASCVFDGCTFKDNGKYGLIRTYFDAEIKDCEFDVDGADQTDVYQDGIHAVASTVRVNGCTNLNGEMKDIINVSSNNDTATRGIIYVDDVLALASPLEVKVSTKAELDAAIAAAEDGDTIKLTADIDYGTTQLAIAKAITLDLGGKTLTTRNAYGGMSLKNNPTIKNGTIVHASNTAAIKVWNATAFEDLVIDVQGKGDANKTIGGIVLQSGTTTRVDSMKNVTIKGVALTNGIETYNCGDATNDVIGSMENVNIDAVGTAMNISAPVGTATGCTFTGGVNGIEIWIKGNYSAKLDLVDCYVEGGVYAHDEFSSNPGIQNIGTLSLTADASTTGASEDDITLTIARAEKVEGVLEAVMNNSKAKVGDTYYPTLEAAITEAKEMTEPAVIDLLGNNATLDKAYVLNNDITFKNGLLLFDNYNGFDPNVYDPAGIYYAVMTIGANVTFDNVILTGKNAVANQGIFVLGTDGVMSLTNGSELNVVAPTATAVIYSEDEYEGKLVVNGSKINIDGDGNAVRGMLSLEIDADNAEITVKNISDNAMRNIKGTVDNSTITVDGAEYGIKNTATGDVLTVTDSTIKVTNTVNESDNAGIYLTGREKLADTNSIINAKIFIDGGEGEDTVLITLNFETNGGDAIGSVEKNQGEVIDLSTYTPIRTGYIFVGWYSDEAMTQQETLVTLNEPMTLYAKWQGRATNGGATGVATHALTFETNGGKAVNKIIKVKNTIIDLSEYITEKDGYIFDGWYADKDFDNVLTSVKLTKNITVYAKWIKKAETGDQGTEEKGLFTDVNTADWFYENVKYVVENKLMNGVTEDKFAPNKALTRAMLVTVLYRNAGEPATNRSIPFGDVDMGAYYANAVSWAKQNGIVNGVTENEFAPDNNITREQIAAIMHRYAQYKGYDVSVGENTNILSYTDAESISEYAVASMQYVVGSGLIKGKSATTLNPKDNATRAEIAAILQRFIEANKK